MNCCAMLHRAAAHAGLHRYEPRRRILDSVNLLRKAGASYALLQCQSTYPAPFKDVNLAYMDRLAEIGQCLVGYSGHERGYHVPVALLRAVQRLSKSISRPIKLWKATITLYRCCPKSSRRWCGRFRDVEESIGTGRAPRGFHR